MLYTHAPYCVLGFHLQINTSSLLNKIVLVLNTLEVMLCVTSSFGFMLIYCTRTFSGMIQSHTHSCIILLTNSFYESFSTT